MSLFDAGDYIGVLKELAGNAENKLVSIQTLYRSLGLDYEDEKRKLRREAIDKMIAQKELESLTKMSLNELRALTDDEEIREIEDEDGDAGNVPGQELEGGGMEGLDMGGMDMGGPPAPPPEPPPV
jgi:hypothetical protein